MNIPFSPDEGRNNTRASFWTRLAAIIIDSYLIFILTFFIVTAARFLGQYIPFELTFLLLAILYSVSMIGWKGYTVGKKLCALSIAKKDGGPVGFIDACIREFIGKFFIILILPSVPIWFLLQPKGRDDVRVFQILLLIIALLFIFLIQYLITKKTWYDYIARTTVVFNSDHRHRARLIVSLLFVTTGTLIGKKAIQITTTVNNAKEMSHYGLAEPSYKDRAPSSLKETSSLSQNEDSEYLSWLDLYGESPREYAIKKASEHQITVFGEVHFNRGHVQFIDDIISDLYHRAGVRCIGLEVCNHEDNKAINRLISAPEYDRELALQIGRNQNWRSWGGKEYWDIFETVWRLNNCLSEGQQKMRVVGIDSRWDLSFSFVFPSEDATKVAIWEKLRIIRAWISIANLIYRDELMAQQIDKQIIQKKDRGIVLVGKNHSFIRYIQRRGKGRMAYMLHQKYSDEIFQIIFHSKERSIKDTDNINTKPDFCDFMERIMAVRNHDPVGFDTIESPFMVLRDSTISQYHYQPNVCFGDITSGFIYLEPRDKFQSCRWVDGFITSEMLAKYKPFYEGRAGLKFNSVQETDDFMKSIYQQQ